MLKNTEFFDVTFEANNEDEIVYRQAVKWKVPRISAGRDGYIVQKVTVTDTIGVVGNYDGPYFEAWLIQNGENLDGSYDDHFQNGKYDPEWGKIIIELCNPPKGIIQYDAQVYWVDKESSVYSKVSKWKPNTVSMAGDLPAVLEKDFHDLDDMKPLFTRQFIHKFNPTTEG